MIFFLLLALTAFSQRPASDTKAAQIGLFPMPGFEPLPPHKSHVPDTANFKPQNFRFKEIDRQSLTDQLAKGIRLPAVDCKTAWGLFTFRVNASGKVDSTWYRGNLSDKVSDQILKNIRETGGHWIVKPETKSTHVAWFSYTFLISVRDLSKSQNVRKLTKNYRWSCRPYLTLFLTCIIS